MQRFAPAGSTDAVAWLARVPDRLGDSRLNAGRHRSGNRLPTSHS
jgi:hypothetical protein